MRLLHTMIRVGDLDRSIEFYTKVLGMRLLRRRDYESGRFTNAFVGYEDESTGAVLELTHNWDTKSYDHGNAYGHVAVEVDDAVKACDDVRARGRTGRDGRFQEASEPAFTRCNPREMRAFPQRSEARVALPVRAPRLLRAG